MDVTPSTILRRALLPVPSPAANTEWSQSVAATELFTAGGWLLKCVAAKLAGGSTTTQPVLVIDDGVNIISESVGATAAQAIGSTCVYTWAPSLVQSGLVPVSGAGADVHAQSPLPMGTECFLNPGWRVRTHTIGLNATSQWSAIFLYVCQIG